MNHLSVGNIAPDFSLPDHAGVVISLSDLYRTQNVLLVYNLGFL